MERRQFIRQSALAAALSACGRAAAASRPNVLLILVDQWRQPRWFPSGVQLPAFDRLRREGISFTNHFASAVPCSPSRACLFTGLHLPQHRVRFNMPVPSMGVPGNQSLDPRLPTIGHAFQRAGYRTPYFGKWHLTQEADYQQRGLADYGFEQWQGPDRDGWPYEGLTRDRGFASQAVRWLEQNGRGQEPWFLTCSLINPHDIMYFKRLDVSPALVPNLCPLPDNFRDDLSGKPRIQRRWREAMGKILGVGPDSPRRDWRQYADFYLWLTRKADHQVGRVLETLDRLKLAGNTLVIFTSDHGEMAGAHGLQGKGPFVYQENNNIPLVLRWPSRLEPNARVSALSQNIDLFPTLLELVGIDPPAHLPGHSLAPALFGDTGVNDHLLMSFGMSAASMPDSAGLSLGALINLTGVDLAGAPGQIRAIHDGRYKFARYFDEGLEPEFELYDLQNDPLELRNLANDPAATRLREEMVRRLASAEAKEMTPPPQEALIPG